MRPVNLIPSEHRRGDQAPARTGRVAPYAVVGVLAAALAGVSLLVLTGNRISESKADLARAQQQSAALEARAERVAAYTAFRTVRDQRTTTVTSLANSRFDWERVLRELSLVLPPDVWLIKVTGTVAPGVSTQEGLDIAQRDTVPGPALELAGCATGQDAVAGLVSALHDIDGVTRVGVSKSELPELSETGTAAGSGTADDCRTRDFIAKFEIILAFDEAPVAGTAPAPAPLTTASATSSGEPTATAGDSSGVAETRQQENASRQSADTQSEKARNAIDTYTP
jgi:Tfp pilus assembly protein PilN